jgi:hypothetical protein
MTQACRATHQNATLKNVKQGQRLGRHKTLALLINGSDALQCA